MTKCMWCIVVHAMGKQTHELPASEWEHSHALEAGMEIFDQDNGDRLVVGNVYDDGEVVLCDLTNGGAEYWSEETMTNALSAGHYATEDGLSHELATF